MGGRAEWGAVRARRMAEPGAQDAYEAARLAFELGRRVRQLREQHGWSQSELARHARMTQSAVARFEAGGTVPTLPVLWRLARALGSELVTVAPPSTAQPATTPAEPEAYVDPSTGEAYEDEDERSLWDLHRLPETTRRQLIYHLREKRAAAERTPRRRVSSQ